MGGGAADDRPGHIETLAYRVYQCAAFPSLADLLKTFIDDEVRVPVSHCVLACAGQVMGDEVANDNLAWPILPDTLRAKRVYTLDLGLLVVSIASA